MSTEQITSSVLVAAGTVVALAALLSALARRIGQPPVIGQVLAGIALGPSVLGRFPGDPSSALVPDEALPFLGVLGQVALVLFMFSVGCELDTSLLRHQGRAVTTVSVAALAVPMAAGVALGRLVLGTDLAPKGIPDGWAFPLYLAVALSITAMPVLASIIRDRGLAGTVPGTVATAAAALTDVVGWLLLAGVVALAGSGGRSPAVVLGLLACYLLAMLAVTRPVLRRTSAIRGTLRDGPLVAVALLSGWATNALGLHAVFGAFLAGLLMPRRRDGSPDPELVSWADRAGSLLLPVFFITTGWSVDIGGLGATDLLLLLALLVVAVAAKLGGCTLAARLGGGSWRQSAVIGALMNTRGLTELIALNVGKQAGLLDGRWYALLVIVAVVTTAMTGPLLSWLRRDGDDTAGRPAPVVAAASGAGSGS
ncbi:cation:proton antiporter [Streptomyces sp. LP11]|uniref:Cation:proton antiporter n=1 Tax=Streptomyces pyxinicus TaxID=2970331 RepID=A0ABT2BB00_9ACTN|nr:cation:proton antiporter [Streptomyces sp. LP11]MCS0605566.1 cation:proton antiporter [Streptomyces sp. LP11]